MSPSPTTVVSQTREGSREEVDTRISKAKNAIAECIEARLKNFTINGRNEYTKKRCSRITDQILALIEPDLDTYYAGTTDPLIDSEYRIHRTGDEGTAVRLIVEDGEVTIHYQSDYIDTDGTVESESLAPEQRTVDNTAELLQLSGGTKGGMRSMIKLIEPID